MPSAFLARSLSVYGCDFHPWMRLELRVETRKGYRLGEDDRLVNREGPVTELGKASYGLGDRVQHDRLAASWRCVF